MAQRTNQRRKRRINRKKQAKRLLFLFAIFILIVLIFVLNFTRLRLMVKGYDFSSQNILLSLDKEKTSEYLDYDTVIDLSYWDSETNDKNYLDYDYYSRLKDTSVSGTILYVDAFYKLKSDLSNLGYSLDISRDLMKVLSIADFEMIVSNQFTYEMVKPYLDINGYIVSDIPAYISSGLEPLDAVLSVSYPCIDASISPTRTYKINDPKKYFGIS